MKTFNTIASIRAALVRTVTELIDYDNQAFYGWQSERLGNDLFINDPDRASRIHDAAENGCDGSTHAEKIADFQDYADEHYSELSSTVWNLETDSTDEAEIAQFNRECSDFEAEVDTAREALNTDISKLEQWHEKNGSLHEQIG